MSVTRGVAAYLNDPDVFDKMMKVEHDPAGRFQWKDRRGEPVKVHPVIAQGAKEMLNKSENEQSAILSTTNYFLSQYLDPVVAE